jgi:hypothetical protein
MSVTPYVSTFGGHLGQGRWRWRSPPSLSTPAASGSRNLLFGFVVTGDVAAARQRGAATVLRDDLKPGQHALTAEYG